MPSKPLLVVCATRSRPEYVRRMIDSVRATSSLADIAVYVDNDQVEMYEPVLRDARWAAGNQVGQCKSLNHLMRSSPGYLAYGAATDDCCFETKGWDLWVQERALEKPISVISPYCEMPERMDFPWATAKWIEVVGQFCYPDTRKSFWDVALQILGDEADAISYSTKADFHISHLALNQLDRNDMNIENERQRELYTKYLNVNDAHDVAYWAAHGRRPMVQRLRQAITELAAVEE